jgi:protein O-mannosyl-transferase
MVSRLDGPRAGTAPTLHGLVIDDGREATQAQGAARNWDGGRCRSVALAGRSTVNRPWQENHRLVLACLLLTAATVAAYWPVTRCDFIGFDDPQYLTENPVVLQGLTWPGVTWAFSTGRAGNWHPLTWLSHMFDVQCFGPRPAAHHLVNLLLHIANTLLLLLLLERVTGHFWRSAFVAALFALHPLHVESVAWVAERKDVLSSFFGLLTIGAYVRYAGGKGTSRQWSVTSSPKPAVESNDSRSRPHRPEARLHLPSSIFYLLALLLFALSLMSKPMLVTLPFLLLLLDYWPLGRIMKYEGRMMKNEGTTPRSRSHFILHPSSFILLEKLPFLVLSAASSLVTFLAQRQEGAVAALDRLPLAGRLSNGAVAYLLYLQKTLWPDRLATFYPLPSALTFWQVAGAVLLLAVISVGVMLARRRPWLSVGWFWFVGMLVPVIGLVQVGAQALADRYTYLPLVGLLIAVTWSVVQPFSFWPGRRPVLAFGAAVLLLSCALLTHRQVQFWQDTEALFRHGLQVTHDNYLAYDQLGTYCAEHGRLPEAIEHLQRSVAIRPRFEPLHNLALALASQGHYAQAIPLYRQALQLRPHEVAARKNLAFALTQSGQVEEAIAEYRALLRTAPGDIQLRNSLGIALTMQGTLEEAIQQFREVLRRDSSQAGSHGNLAYALLLQHKCEEAGEHYRAILQSNPDDARAHQGLAKALAEQGKPAEAVEQFSEAVRLSPANPTLHYEFGLALERQGQREQAAAHYAEALRLKPDFPEARRRLEAHSPLPNQ